MENEQSSIQSTTRCKFTVNKVGIDAPFRWLSKGFDDLKTSKVPSLAYGFVFALIGLLLTVLAAKNPVWSAAFTTAFFLIGPFLAIGLYDLSRQIEEGQRTCLLDSIHIIKDNLINIGIFVVALGFLLMLWLRIAALVAGIFFNNIELITEGWSVLFTSDHSAEFFLFFIVFGFFIALLSFSISVVSMPLLLHRKVDIITAITTSLCVVIKNPLTMMIWAALIVVLINLGIVVAFIGLVVALPVIGHASWHAYKDLVGEAR